MKISTVLTVLLSCLLLAACDVPGIGLDLTAEEEQQLNEAALRRIVERYGEPGETPEAFFARIEDKVGARKAELAADPDFRDTCLLATIVLDDDTLGKAIKDACATVLG